MLLALEGLAVLLALAGLAVLFPGFPLAVAALFLALAFALAFDLAFGFASSLFLNASSTASAVGAGALGGPGGPGALGGAAGVGALDGGADPLTSGAGSAFGASTGAGRAGNGGAEAAGVVFPSFLKIFRFARPPPGPTFSSMAFIMAIFLR